MEEKTFISIQEAINKGEGTVNIRGWVYRERGSNKFRFIVLRDSTNIIQCILSAESVSEEIFESAKKLQVEASIELTGTLRKEERAPTGVEMDVTSLVVVGESDTFPISKDQSPEFLLDVRHLSLRTRKLTAVMKIRSRYVQARENFFQSKGFHRFDAPILQPNQCEGGSTLFEVKYYESTTYLSQTWQLYAESAVFALEKIYNFGPTFRAEKSKTSRHLSEFWMAEAEVAWFKLNDISKLAKEELKYCIKDVAENCEIDLELLGQNPAELIEMTKKEWPSIKYREALKFIREKEGVDVKFGKDLRTIEEQALMKHYDVPVVVTHYPVEVMAFYKPRDPEVADEALCFDMLAPGIGVEIVGGSERSTDVEDMKKRLEAEGETISNYDWYFDLRKYGSVPHSGYGVGTERVIAWICGLENIKDAIPFPRTMLRYKP